MIISATMPSTSAHRPNFIDETTLLSLALAATLHRDQLARQPLVDPTAVAVRLLHSLHGQSIHDQTLGWLFATHDDPRPVSRVRRDLNPGPIILSRSLGRSRAQEEPRHKIEKVGYIYTYIYMIIHAYPKDLQGRSEDSFHRYLP